MEDGDATADRRAPVRSSGDGAASQSLTEKAYREIEERIVTLQYEPGQVLSESFLVEQHNIGRTPIREALQRLALEDLVAVMPRRGIRVTEINVARQLALLEVRREIERLVARGSAVRARPEQQARFKSLAGDLKRSAELKDDIMFMRLDREFNRLCTASCRNDYAARMMQLIEGLSRRFWYQHYREVLDLPRCALLHHDVARAIAERDSDAAASASDALIDYIEEFTRATI